jgi:H+/Cl- antiporter ClcA
MSTPTRRKLGLVLIGISVVSGIIVAFATVKTGDAQVVSQGGQGNYYYIVSASSVTSTHPRWLVPSLVLMVGGIACLIWPSRKPPRLTS